MVSSGDQSELADRVAGGADDRRLGEAAGGEPCRHAPIQVEHPGRGQDAEQAGEAHDESGNQLVQRTPVQGMKELRAALKSDRVDEQREKYRLDAAVDIDAELTNDDADQQRSRDAAKNEVADLQFSDEVAERDGEEEREQGLCREQSVQQVHVSLSMSIVQAAVGRWPIADPAQEDFANHRYSPERGEIASFNLR